APAPERGGDDGLTRSTSTGLWLIVREGAARGGAAPSRPCSTITSWARAGHELGTSWARAGHELGTSWAHAGHELGTSWARAGRELVASSSRAACTSPSRRRSARTGRAWRAGVASGRLSTPAQPMSDDAYLAVINPAAGGGRCGKRFPAALERLREAGVAVDTAQTSAPGEATELVRAAWAEGRRRFIAVGGDGTGYEVVNGLFPAANEAG